MKREVFKTRNHKVFKIIDELIVEYQNHTLGEDVGLSDFVRGMGCIESLKKLRERLENESLALDFSSICDSIEYAIKTPQNYYVLGIKEIRDLYGDLKNPLREILIDEDSLKTILLQFFINRFIDKKGNNDEKQ